MFLNGIVLLVSIVNGEKVIEHSDLITNEKINSIASMAISANKENISSEKNKEKVDDSKTLVNPLSSIEEIKVKSSKLTGDIVNNSKINPNLRLSNNYPNQFINSMPGNFNPRPPQSLM